MNTPDDEAGAPDAAETAAAGFSRRAFVRGGSAAMGVGAALVWSGPAIRSIRLAANAGSPMPPTTSETVIPDGSTIPMNTTSSSSTLPPGNKVAAGPPAHASSAENTLPFTGAAIATTAAAGAGAIVAGRALMSARRRPPEALVAPDLPEN
ncbi:MAG TPA: hypothetical protein VEZ15_05650 [Acidimicrobiia bacterium]|nr:hypothetical protein [Acidimicrobiia bacterium]